MSRILAVDWGQRRIGVAITDATGTLPRPLPTLEVTGFRDALRQLSHVARDEDVTRVVMGLPRLKSGEGESARRARKLGKGLEARGYPVVYLDETLTSDDARRWLRERGETSPKSGRIDQVAALLILQEYLAGETGESHA